MLVMHIIVLCFFINLQTLYCIGVTPLLLLRFGEAELQNF